ncbi:unnamed protein product, partial [Rotaria sp. Silwood2]
QTMNGTNTTKAVYETARFSVSIYFLCLFILLTISLISFVLLQWTSISRNTHQIIPDISLDTKDPIYKQLEQQELKRIEKEKYCERQVLIRDLFSIPKDRLCEELIHNNLPDTDVKIYLKREVDSKKLSSEYPLLYYILQKVSKEFEIDPVHMLYYLKEKKDSNKSFHLDADLAKYVYEHTNYDLKQFLETKKMYPLDEKEYVLLQPVFINSCRTIDLDD